ncbi:MAG: site-2 protease family protein [Oxalobacter sp.]|nr:MAG: site-2 protease family protein [Oxalobacter sp.]
MNSIQTFAVHLLPILLAITLHEAAHAYVARYFGDTTAYAQGRMTLNPIKHIDPIGTIAIPLALFVIGSPYLFGYAKPVPVNFSRLRNPRKHSALVSLAGPGANLIMALMWLVLAIGLKKFQIQEEFFLRVAEAGVLDNLVFFAFNLFPIPPLDGGRILTSILPYQWAHRFVQLEPYGFFIVMALVMLKVLRYWMVPVMTVAHELLQALVIPLKLLL